MEQQPLPIGVDDFGTLITSGYYFVDKTMFIRDLIDKKGQVNLFTRPRRFGKSLNISMLRYFFEEGRDLAGETTDYSHLFTGLKITECGDQYLQHMGKYPVIHLSLKSAKRMTFEHAIGMLVPELAYEFTRHKFILEDPRLENERDRYMSFMLEKAEPGSYSKSLKFLSECLHSYYGKKVIILIDEYDVPLESAYLNGYYDEMVDFIRSLFEAALKTNPHLEFAVLTGCLRISKESIFTGMTNLEIISILNKNYDEYFGFTNEEVKKICRDFGMTDKLDIFQSWYNGYVFGNANVFNPWSIVRYVKDLLADRNEFPISYWANTSSNSIVRNLIDRADRDVKDEIESLIAGGTIEKPVHEDITYDEMYASMDNLWNFMFFTGYFRKVGERMTGRQWYITLKIPNEEVRYIFETKILNWFDEQIKKRDQKTLFHAFLNQDAETVQNEIEDMLIQTISFYDTYESFYHGFLAGILYGIDGYVVKSNREGGTGRTDLFIKPVSRRKTAYVVEFKVAKTYRELANRAEDALAQIAEKNYGRELIDDGYESVVCYGIAFFGKDCEVRISNEY